MTGGAKLLFKGVTVVGESVQGSEGQEGVPHIGAPEPGVGGGGCCPRDDRGQAAEYRVENCEEGGQAVSRAGGPHMS
jgi:hypothetical protein